MRNWIGAAALAMIAAGVIAAPVARPKPTLAMAKKALADAGPAASNEQVAAAYPRFLIHPQPPAPWFVARTDSGCLYYDYFVTYDPPAKWPQEVLAIMRERFDIRWTGSPCTPGKFISGTGTLQWGDTNVRNAGRRAVDYDRLTGTMVNGVFQGKVRRLYSYDVDGKQPIGGGEFEMFGGCRNLDPKMVIREFPMCQPRLP